MPEDEEWDEDNEDEDTDEEEDYIDEPPAFVSPPPSPAYAPADQEPDRHQPAQGQSRLGRDIQTGKYVEVTQASRRQGLYIIGIQGTGKSVLIENLIIQDIKQNNIGVCVLDPHGDLINAVLSRLPKHREKDVIYLDILDYRYPFGINLFTCSDLSDIVEVQKTVDQVVHVFEKLLGVSHDTPLILNYLKSCTRTLIANPGYTMADIPLLLQDGECRRKLVANVTDIDVQRFWRLHNQKKPVDQNFDIASTLRRVDEFLQPLSRNIVGQGTSTIDIRQVMDEGKILLVRLDTSVESITELIGSLFIALFLTAAKSRADLPVNKRRQFNLYADEFQRFSTEDFATLLEEARKYGVATTIAHQNRGQLDSKNSQLETNLKDRTRSAANLVVFRINSKDAGDLAGEFDITPQEAWEEEIEPEWVEIVTPQRHERVEEQVEVEVEDDILEVTQDPVGFLLGVRTTSENRKVREAIRTVDPRALNGLLVNVMEKRIELGSEEFVKKIIRLVRENFSLSILDDIAFRPDIQEEWPTWRIHWQQCWKDFVTELAVGSHETRLEKLRQNLIEANIVNEFNQRAKEEINALYVNRSIAYSKMSKTEQERVKEEIRQECEKRVREDWERIDRTARVATYVKNVKILCEALAKEPIMVPTGKKRLVKRIQPHITYLPHESEKISHPRKTIMHPQRTYADVLNEVASQLTNLPVFTAKVKITTDAGIKEHLIRTLDPMQDSDRPLLKQALEDRIARIKAQNIQDGYVRERIAVEAEIRQRQEQCSEPPTEEPPISRHPPR